MSFDPRHRSSRARTMCAAFLVFATIAVIPQLAAAQTVTVCHRPPGNPANAHEIAVSVNSVPAHIDHGDFLGPCLCTPADQPGGPNLPACCAGSKCVASGTTFVCQTATSSDPMPPGGACTSSTQCDALNPCTSVGTNDSVCGG